MTNLLETFLPAFLLFLMALAFLGVGWILTGKSRIIRGACGMDPKKIRDKKCGTSNIHCDLCEQKKDDPENLPKE